MLLAHFESNTFKSLSLRYKYDKTLHFTLFYLEYTWTLSNEYINTIHTNMYCD